MIVTFLERLCTASGHRFGPLCSYVVRQDAWWLSRNTGRAGASPVHCEKRERFDSGMLGLPFPTGAAAAAGTPEAPSAPDAASPFAARHERQAKSA